MYQANGPHEKNEDAAVIARLLRPDPTSSSDAGSSSDSGGSGGGSGGGGACGISVCAAHTGAGLKNDDPPGRPLVNNPRAPLSARAARLAANVRATSLQCAAAAVAGGCGGGVGCAPTVVAHLAGVLDGHGGRGTAKWASRRLPTLIAENLQRDPSLSLTAALSNSLRSFDRWWANAMHDPEISRYGHDDSGSTAMLALVAPAPAPAPAGAWRLAVANLGDSRALLVSATEEGCGGGGGDGSSSGSENGGGWEVAELSEVHNTGNPAELERLLAAGAQVVQPAAAGAGAAAAAGGHARFFTRGPIWGKQGLKVSRALGDIQFKRPQQLVTTDPFCAELLLPRGSRHRALLLLSDGVTDVLPDRDIAAIALEALGGGGGRRGAACGAALAAPPDDAARAAAEAVVSAAARHAAAHDNMTCACVVFGAPGDGGGGA